MPIPSLEDVRAYNVWSEGQKFDVPAFQRSCLNSVEGALRRNFVVAVTGLRRVGKSTLIKQLGNALEGDKFFFSFEEDIFANYESLKHVVETFVRMGEKPVIFLDEIGRIKGWAGLVKKYHDLNKARFVVSGSAGLQIAKGKESLAGRLAEFELPPWQFGEYLALAGIETKPIEAKNIEKAFLQWNHQGTEHVEGFLKKGGFPELHAFQNEADVRRYIKATTVEKIVFEDIPAIFNIESKDKLYDIMAYIARESGSIFNPSHVGEALEVSKDTVRNYAFYLRHAYLVDFLPIEGSTLKSFRRPKKAYAACPAISFGFSDSYNEGKLVETAVFGKLRSAQTRFYRDAQKREVDFVGPVVVESKWRQDVTWADLHNLLYYMKKRRIEKAFVVAKEFDVRERDGKTIYALPLAFFLLLPPSLIGANEPALLKVSE